MIFTTQCTMYTRYTSEWHPTKFVRFTLRFSWPSGVSAPEIVLQTGISPLEKRPFVATAITRSHYFWESSERENDIPAAREFP